MTTTKKTTTKKKRTKKSNAGRPTVMTKEVIAKLEECFLADISDAQACYIAGIDPCSLYRYQEAHPEYCKRKETLRKMPIAKAKIIINNRLNQQDPDTAKWLLERKAKKEYSKLATMEIDTGVTVIEVADKKDKDALEADYSVVSK